jgi:gamma-glutamylputrescine oxidase
MTESGALPHDPLRGHEPGEGLPLPDSYWAATSGAQVEDDGALELDREADVVVIGGGYTGLSCAYHLAKKHGANVVVLEANVPGWGCSGRNGGCIRPGIGRLPLRHWSERWGTDGAEALFAQQLAALHTVRNLIDDGDIDCDLQDTGQLRVAHRPANVAGLEADHKLMSETFGYGSQMLDAGEIERDYFKSDEAYAALKFPDGFGLHPLKLAQGVLRMARQAGAVVHRASPVTGWRADGPESVVTTPKAQVRAKHVVVATNGYTGDGLHPAFKARTLPVLSNIIVTRPMTPEEKAAANFVSTVPISDTRHVLFYYRRLPDDRIMIGGRGPIDGRTADDPKWKARLLDALRVKFPALSALTMDYYWAGWVCLPYDSMPHVHHLDKHPNVWFSLGYCGIGVAPALHFGSLLADRIGGGDSLPDALARPIPRFPMAAFRRLGQRAMYGWYQFQDR